MEQKLEETAYLINVETDEGEEEEELLGGLQRRRPRPTKNFDASTVPANLVPAGISKASSSDVSAITSEEQEPEPEPEPGREHWKQHGPDKDFEVNANHLVSNVGPADGDAVAAAGAGDRVVADGNDRNGVGEFDEQQLLQSVSFEKEQGNSQSYVHFFLVICRPKSFLPFFFFLDHCYSRKTLQFPFLVVEFPACPAPSLTM